MTARTLIVLSESCDVRSLRRVCESGHAILALAPGVRAVLRRAGIASLDSLAYFGAEGHASVLEASERMLGHLAPALCSVSRPPVRAAFTDLLLFRLRFQLRHWLALLHIVDQAVSALDADELRTSGGGANASASDPIGAVVSAYTRATGLQFRHLDVATRRRAGWRAALNGIPAWLDVLLFEFMLWRNRSRMRGTHPILVAGSTYGMPALVTEIQAVLPASPVVYLSAGARFIRERLSDIASGRLATFRNTRTFLGSEDRQTLDAQLREMRETVNTLVMGKTDLFRYRGVGLEGVICHVFLPQLEREASDLYRQARGIERILKTFATPAVALAQHALGLHGALGEACRHGGIPSLLVTHGSHVPQDDPLARTEWALHARTIFNARFGHLAVQTPWAAEFLAQQKTVAAPLATGPLLFAVPGRSRLSRPVLRKRVYGTHAAKFIVLHAGTPKPWHALRPWVYETADEYIQNINDLIEAAEQLPNVHIAIRFRPMPGLSETDFRTLIRSSSLAAVYSAGAFADHLLGADLLVSYSSTAIEEALQSEVPVLLYDPDGKYHHLPGHRLSPGGEAVVNTVYHVDQRADLPEALAVLTRIHGEALPRPSIDWSKHRLPVVPVRDWLTELGVSSRDLKEHV